MPTVNVLPFDKNLGYPQRQKFKINDEAYNAYYRWNSQGFCVLKIVRIEDSAIVFNGKLAVKNPYEARDPQTYEVLFTILPWNVDSQNCEVWVFWT